MKINDPCRQRTHGILDFYTIISRISNHVLLLLMDSLNMERELKKSCESLLYHNASGGDYLAA